MNHSDAFYLSKFTHFSLLFFPSQQSQQLNGAWNSYTAQQQSLPNLPNRTDIGQTTITLANLNAHQTPHTASALPQQIPPAHNQAQIPSIQTQPNYQSSPSIGQENIVRVFDELMKNIARMKIFIRPSMCKPYGKQSESLQKSEFHFFALKRFVKPILIS